MDIIELQSQADKIKHNIEKVIIGKSQVIDLILTSLLAVDIFFLKMYLAQEKQYSPNRWRNHLLLTLNEFNSHRIFFRPI